MTQHTRSHIPGRLGIAPGIAPGIALAIALGLAAGCEHEVAIEPDRAVRVRRYERAGVSAVYVERVRSAGYEDVRSRGPRLPSWISVERSAALDAGDARGHFQGVHASGWPWRSMRFSLDRSGGAGAYTLRGGREVRGSFPTPAGHDRQTLARTVPLDPIWPGFAGNSVLYALAAWLAGMAGFRWRRGRRLKRGRCPRCAYPIGASDACSECGERVRSRVRPAPG